MLTVEHYSIFNEIFLSSKISTILIGRLNEDNITQTSGDSPRVELCIGKKLVSVPIPLEDGKMPLSGCGTSKSRYDKREADDMLENDIVNARFEDLESKIDKLVERVNELCKRIK